MGYGSFTLIEICTTRKLWYGFALHSNYGPILYHLGDKALLCCTCYSCRVFEPINWNWKIYWSKIATLGQRFYGTLRSPYVVAIPSVCCRLSVTFVTSQPILTRLNFSAVFLPRRIDSDCRTDCVTILDRNSRGYISTSKLSGRGGIKNWRVLTNISFHFEKHPGYKLGNTP